MNTSELRSPRLRRVFDYLSLHISATTKEIEDKCCVASARDYIRRLRDHGIKIQTIEEGISQTGARIVRYKILLDAIAQPRQLTLL
jgi:hypothetical protein